MAVDFFEDAAEVVDGRETGLVCGVGDAVAGGEEQAGLVQAEVKQVIARGGFEMSLEESGEAGGVDAAVAGDFGDGDRLAVVEAQVPAGFLEGFPAEGRVPLFLPDAEGLEDEGGDLG